MSGVAVERSALVLEPDPRRVIGRRFVPGEDPTVVGQPRLEHLVSRILDLPDDVMELELADIRRRFATRHRDLDLMLLRNSEGVAHLLDGVGDERCRLVGSYLTHEIAVEAAALTNPSIVPAPDQTGVPPGALRIVLSLRAVSEGHISSIEFRTGLILADGSVTIDPATGYAETGERRAPIYERKLFSVKLGELRADMGLAAQVLDQLPRHFGLADLDTALKVLDDVPHAASHETIKLIRWLASSNYMVEFDASRALDERVLFPVGPLESRGMEDARFVRFVEDDGTSTYYATYTAFDGFEILPQLIETNDFRTFEISTLNGRSAQNKGIAFFPRPVNGRYMVVSRPDRENIHVISSDNPRFWQAPSKVLRVGRRAWELIQTGNCGSPLETSDGWLLLTHGVGPMRTYRIGAVLLDLDEPTNVIAELDEPILVADESERDGYVPNVVYSCGGLIHEGRVVLPYGLADRGTRFAQFSVSDLLDAMRVTNSAARRGRPR
jgi:predicted GH43/DUF377 family glycosyl hydrolase